jgi:hypothetical protein
MNCLISIARTRRALLAVGVVMSLACQVRADVTLNVTGLYDGWGSPVVEIQYTAKGGGSTQAWVYDDPQVVSGMLDGKGHSLPFYCVDLLHDNYLPSTYHATVGPAPGFGTSSYGDAANRVAWAIESASLSGYGPAATQLLVWAVIDKGFSVINWNGNDGGAGSLKATYDALVGELANPTKGYDPKTDYLASVTFYNAVHDSSDSLFQSLASPSGKGPGPRGPSLAPEPSSLVIACFGILGLLGVRNRIRRTA